MTRIFVCALIAGCAAREAVPPQEKLKGVEIADLDRKADPCEDFFEFSNGAWRAANPIPASMQRWSRRWQAGEQNKEKLRDILEDLSRGRWPEGSVEQQVADHYGSCMDEKVIDAAGVTPLAPPLAEVDKAQNSAGVHPGGRRLQDLAVGAPFGFGSFTHHHPPTRPLAGAAPGGLGLRDPAYF